MNALILEQLTIRMILWDLSMPWKKMAKELEFQKLYKETIEAQIPVVEWKEWIEKEVQYAIVVTDDPMLSEKLWKEKQYAVVYYEQTEPEEMVHADYVVQGFEEVGIQFLDRILKRHLHLPWTILFTERTLVREISLSDLDELFSLYEDESITEYTEPLYGRREEEEYTKQYIETMYYYYGYGLWTVWNRKTGQLIGRVGIDQRADETTGETWLELGYIIGKNWQRQGYATEVCQKVIEYAKENLHFPILYCVIHPQNTVSIHLAKKLGFRFERRVLIRGKEYCRYKMGLI